MSIVTIFLVLFYILGLAVGPLLLAFATRSFSKERGRSIGKWALRIGLKSIYRPAITFNSADELALKRRSYDEKHDTEYVAFGGMMNQVRRYLHDPQDRIHSLYGIPFGFVDELFGLVFDPRDVVVARELRHHQENDVYEYQVEKDNKLHESVRAVFEIPRGHVGVKLSDIQRIVGGSLDSQVVDRIREIYKKSQDPKLRPVALLRLMSPLLAFTGVVLLGMFVAGQGAGGGGGSPVPSPSGNSSTINVGASILFLLFSMADPRAVNWRDVTVGAVFVVLGIGFAAMMTVAMPGPYTMLMLTLPLGAWSMVMFGLGLVTMPFIAFWFGRSLGGLGVGLGKLYTIIGLLPYSRPVIDYHNGEYRIVEYAEHDWEIDPHWYRFAMTRIGIGMVNEPENWPRGTVLEEPKVRAMADGGVSDLPAPAGHTATELIAVQDINGFVPEDPADDSVFVRTDRTTGWMMEAGQPRRLLTSGLLNAKEELGGGRAPVSDTKLYAGVLAGMVAGAIFDVVVFF